MRDFALGAAAAAVVVSTLALVGIGVTCLRVQRRLAALLRHA